MSHSDVRVSPREPPTPGCSLYAANHLNLSKRRNSLDRLGFFLFQEGIYEDLANRAGFVGYPVSWLIS